MKVILKVDAADVMTAAKLAVGVAKDYRAAVSPKDKVKFKINGKYYAVHETAKDTIVVSYGN